MGMISGLDERRARGAERKTLAGGGALAGSAGRLTMLRKISHIVHQKFWLDYEYFWGRGAKEADIRGHGPIIGYISEISGLSRAAPPGHVRKAKSPRPGRMASPAERRASLAGGKAKRRGSTGGLRKDHSHETGAKEADSGE
jgi:hypothetical protein